MDKREPVTILGKFVGTATGWDQVDDLAIVLYEFEPYEGFEVPTDNLTVDFVAGTVKNYDDEGNETFNTDMITVMNGFIARQHYNKKKAA